jgi:hypothetical protein
VFSRVVPLPRRPQLLALVGKIAGDEVLDLAAHAEEPLGRPGATKADGLALALKPEVAKLIG